MTILVIARHTFKEAVRDRVLYLLLFFSVLSIVLARVLAVLTVGDRVKVIKDVGLASIGFFGALMAILIGTGLVYKEIEKRTIFTLISKPIRRFEFLLGKYLGLVWTLAVMVAAMTAIYLVVVFLHTFTIEIRMVLAVFFIFLELMLLTAVAILFSSFSTPILSSLFALSFYLIGHFSWSLETLIKKTPPGARKALLRTLYAILPDLENFNIKTEVVQNLPLPAGLWVGAVGYAAVYTAFVLILAVWVFRQRDFV
jgi:ABC-type transport system involved in multi-copper enzyme maturation permease subunit